MLKEVVEWSLSYTLERGDIASIFLVYALVLNAYAILSYLFIHPKKRFAWMISLLNSTLMCLVGALYLVVKLAKHPEAFVFGSDGPTLLYGTDNLAVVICIWFGLANVTDFLYGVLFYREYLSVLTTYVHHSVFIWIMYFAPTGNGLFCTSTPFAPAFCLMLIEEIPTFFLALGSVFPSYRTDIGFGFTFFIFRIVYHLYFTAYAIYSALDTPVIVLYCLTLAMHVNWFYTWVVKYGKKSLSGSSSTDKKTLKKN